MAGNAIIGALRVVLGADSAALEQGLKDAQGKLAAFGAGVAKAGAVAAAAFATTGIAVAAAVRGSISEADKLGKLAQSVGVPVEELSKLKYAADLSGVGIEELGKSLGKLGKNLTDAAAKPTSDAANAFRALGVATTDSNGKLRSQNDVLLDVAEKFSGLKDGAGKTAVAMAIFGKAGAAMIPLLNQGRAGIRDLTNEAAQLGLVIDDKTAKAAEAFNDNLTRMGAIKDGIIKKIAAGMLPALQNLSQILVDAGKNTALMNEVSKALSVTLQGLVTGVIAVAAAFKVAYTNISTFIQAVSLAISGDFAGAWAAIQKGAGDSLSTLQGAFNAIKGVWTGTAEAADAAAASTGNATKQLKDFNYAAMGGKSAIDSFIDSLKKRTAGLQAELPLIGQSNKELERAKIVAEGLALAQANHIPITEKLKQRLTELATTYATLNDAVTFGKQVFDQTRTPLEQYGETIERLNNAFQAGAINADTYARGVAQAQQQFVQADPYARAFGQSLETAFDKAIQGGAQLKDILRGLLQDLSRALANEAFRSLIYGSKGGTSGGLAGGIFGGIGKLFGFADGGSFQVGGSGGIDSQLVAFKASPNERVSVTKPGQGTGGWSGQPIVQNFYNTFQGMTGSDRQWAETRMATIGAQAKNAAVAEMRAGPQRRG